MTQAVKYGDPKTEKQREAPAIKTKALQWQSEGFAWREAFVRLPQGLTLQDLNDAPTIWKNIQGDANTALRQFDCIRAVSYEQTWFVDATVSFADRNQVILCGIKKTDMPKREIVLFEDETYRVDWAGAGYGVFRKSDSVMMGAQTFSTTEGAKQHLISLYPTRKVA